MRLEGRGLEKKLACSECKQHKELCLLVHRTKAPPCLFLHIIFDSIKTNLLEYWGCNLVCNHALLYKGCVAKCSSYNFFISWSFRQLKWMQKGNRVQPVKIMWTGIWLSQYKKFYQINFRFCLSVLELLLRGMSKDWNVPQCQLPGHFWTKLSLWLESVKWTFASSASKK